MWFNIYFMSHHFFHQGSNKPRRKADVMKYDVVLTTYHVRPSMISSSVTDSKSLDSRTGMARPGGGTDSQGES